MKRLVSFTLVAICSFLWTECLQAQNAITYWKDGVPTIIHSLDSVFFWNAEDFSIDGTDEESIAGQTDIAEQISQMSSDEENVTTTEYNEEGSVKYDAMARDVIGTYGTSGSQSSRRKADSLDDLAQEVIRTNGTNIFSGLIIEQQDWDSGLWGKTRYAGSRDGGFETFFNTFMEGGKRYLSQFGISHLEKHELF